MHARFYDPTIGRWLSEDPVQDKHFEPATLNFYAYVYDNPLGYVDPDGKVAIPVLIGAGLHALRAIAQQAATVFLASKIAQSPQVAALARSLTSAAIRVALATRLVGTYSQVQRFTQGSGGLYHAHHIIPARFASLFGMNPNQLPAIALPGNLHISHLTAQLNSLFAPGQSYTLDQVIDILKNFLGANYPQLLEYLQNHPDWTHYFGG
jgi:hypothetical protein